MAAYTCPRCGYESHCSHGTWYDRHPAAAAALGMFSVMFSLVVVVGHPWLLLVAALGAGAYAVDREHRRRRALAARADWEHRAIMDAHAADARDAPLPPVRELPALPRLSPEVRRRRRPADHWSITEPMRSR